MKAQIQWATLEKNWLGKIGQRKKRDRNGKRIENGCSNKKTGKGGGKITGGVVQQK